RQLHDQHPRAHEGRRRHVDARLATPRERARRRDAVRTRGPRHRATVPTTQVRVLDRRQGEGGGSRSAVLATHPRERARTAALVRHSAGGRSMRTIGTMGLVAVLALGLVTGAAEAKTRRRATSDSGAPDATLRIEQKSVALGIGYQWGRGTLSF